MQITFKKPRRRLKRLHEKTEIRIAGLGGQGVVLAGQLLAKAAVYDGKHVVQTQSYGAEARGSAAQSEVIISDRVIKYPKVRQCDILIAMSQPALNKYVKNLKEGGVLFLDRDMIKTVPKLEARIFQVPATSTAETKLKRKIYANTIMLGALTKVTTIISQEAMKSTIKDSVPKEMLRKNLQGFQLGLQLMEGHRAAT